VTAAFMAACPDVAVAQAPIPRPTPYAGAVISTKGGEELQLRAEADWRSVVVTQNLVGGDTLRTNSAGAVAVLFEDRTQVRVARNSTLIVKEVATAAGGTTRLSLPEGSIFARAARGGTGVTVETPAAAAAIRGTDWSLAVDGPKTSLVVLEGTVTLANPQGSVTVAQGEGAEALIGQAPRKITLVDYDGRRQLLLYRELRDSFFDLTPTDVPRREQRARRAALKAVAAERRTAEDWLADAELALSYDGSAVAAQALAQAELRALAPAQQARADLVRGFLAARVNRWAEAASLFRRAAPRLDERRRETAAYASWVADTLANPSRKAAPLPQPARYARTAQGALAQASVESFTESNQHGVDLLAGAERQYPDDALIVGARAALQLSVGDRKAAEEQIERARAVDPGDPFVLLLTARYKWTIKSDLDGARADVLKALDAAPGSSLAWNELALIEDERQATREAELAHLKSIELDPQNPLVIANYANFLINHNQIVAADAVVKQAEAIDPAGAVQVLTRGRLLVREGKTQEGLQKLLAASAINPSYVDGLLELAIAQYRAGLDEEVAQSLDNADRFDNDNPETPLVRSIIAQDQYRADEGILAARESLRRRLARGGYFASFGADRQDGSPVNSALRFLSLDSWGRYFGDRTFEPFSAFSYFDQATASRPSPVTALLAPEIDPDGTFGQTAFSSTIQGLLLEPLAATSPERRESLVFTDFAETAIEGGLRSEGGQIGWQTEATAQARSVSSPIPFAVYLTGTIGRPDSSFADDRNDLLSGTALIGAQPTINDNLVAFAFFNKQKTDFRTVDQLSLYPDRLKPETMTAGIGWSHTFGDRNVLQFLFSGTHTEQRQRSDALLDVDGDGGPDFFTQRRLKGRETDAVGAVSHLIGFGDVSLRYGAEGSLSDGKLRDFRNYQPIFRDVETIRSKIDGRIGTAYADAIWDVSAKLKIEGGLFATSVDYDTRADVCSITVGVLIPGPCTPPRFIQKDDAFNVRIGAAWEPVSGHWLRAAYREDTTVLNNTTLAPVATVGLLPNEAATPIGGRTKTIAARWDAEWGAHLFTSLEYQSQKASDLSIGIPESLESADFLDARIRRLEANANLWLTHGVGLFARYARNWTDIPGGGDVPYVADNVGRIGVTFVHPSMVRLTIAQNFIGRRNDASSQIPFTFVPDARLEAVSTTNAALTWEPFDKRVRFELQGVNLFDKRYVVQSNDFPVAAPGFFAVPRIEGQRRTILATARFRL
jgi:predicted Zn-dependent protease